MGTHEEPLRQRFCRGIDCGRVFWICRHCYRGHKYCSDRCRQKTRGQQIRAAKRKHQKSPEGRADPRDPTTKYFLNRFLHDHFGRRRATVQQYWPRSLRFLSTDLANAAFTATNEEIAMLAAGITLEELRVENVILRIQANPAEPHGAVADFVLVRTQQEREISREQWTATMQFVFMPVIPADLVIFNPMGIQVTYLETDRALITETP